MLEAHPREINRSKFPLEGKSASSIAAALGAPSRNAVIGKANRIGVKLTGNIHCSAPRASRPSTVRPRRPAIARTEALWKRAVVPPPGPRERKPARPSPAQVERDVEDWAEEISESACRWPIGDPTTGGIRLLRHSDREEGRSLLRRTHCRMKPYKPPNGRVWDEQRVTWPSSRWPPETRNEAARLSARRMGAARPREQPKLFARARFFCLSRIYRFGRMGKRFDRRSDGQAFGEFSHVERVLHQPPARNGHGQGGADRDGDPRPSGAKKNILTVDDVRGALTTAQSSLISSPTVHGFSRRCIQSSSARSKERLFARRERGHRNERRAISGPEPPPNRPDACHQERRPIRTGFAAWRTSSPLPRTRTPAPDPLRNDRETLSADKGNGSHCRRLFVKPQRGDVNFYSLRALASGKGRSRYRMGCFGPLRAVVRGSS